MMGSCVLTLLIKIRFTPRRKSTTRLKMENGSGGGFSVNTGIGFNQRSAPGKGSLYRSHQGRARKRSSRGKFPPSVPLVSSFFQRNASRPLSFTVLFSKQSIRVSQLFFVNSPASVSRIFLMNRRRIHVDSSCFIGFPHEQCRFGPHLVSPFSTVNKN